MVLWLQWCTRLEVIIVVLVNISVLWVMMSCRLVCTLHDCTLLKTWILYSGVMCGLISHYHSKKCTKHGYAMHVNELAFYSLTIHFSSFPGWVGLCWSVLCHGWCDDALCLLSVVVLLAVYFPFLTNKCHLSVANGRTMMGLLVASILQGSTNVKFLQSQYRSHFVSLHAGNRAEKCDFIACVMIRSWMLIHDILRNDSEQKQFKLSLCWNFVIC